MYIKIMNSVYSNLSNSMQLCQIMQQLIVNTNNKCTNINMDINT